MRELSSVDDYDGASYPGHAKFATSCEDCHSTEAWKPARAPGRDRNAPQPQPAATPARSTKARPSTADRGASDGANPQAAQPWHPESRFPIKHGSHSDIDCRTCHDQGGALSKSNTDCVQCHTRARFDRKHRHVDAYPQGDAPANFCLKCHTDGTVDSAR